MLLSTAAAVSAIEESEMIAGRSGAGAEPEATVMTSTDLAQKEAELSALIAKNTQHQEALKKLEREAKEAYKDAKDELHKAKVEAHNVREEAHSKAKRIVEEAKEQAASSANKIHVILNKTMEDLRNYLSAAVQKVDGPTSYLTDLYKRIFNNKMYTKSEAQQWLRSADALAVFESYKTLDRQQEQQLQKEKNIATASEALEKSIAAYNRCVASARGWFFGVFVWLIWGRQGGGEVHIPAIIQHQKSLKSALQEHKLIVTGMIEELGKVKNNTALFLNRMNQLKEQPLPSAQRDILANFVKEHQEKVLQILLFAYDQINREVTKKKTNKQVISCMDDTFTDLIRTLEVINGEILKSPKQDTWVGVYGTLGRYQAALNSIQSSIDQLVLELTNRSQFILKNAEEKLNIGDNLISKSQNG